MKISSKTTYKCTKKKLTKIEADYALDRISKKKNIGKRAEHRSYFCKKCNAYHLTSKIKYMK